MLGSGFISWVVLTAGFILGTKSLCHRKVTQIRRQATLLCLKMHLDNEEPEGGGEKTEVLKTITMPLRKIFLRCKPSQGGNFDTTVTSKSQPITMTRSIKKIYSQKSQIKTEMVMAICIKPDTVAEARIARKDPLISPHCPSESLILVKRSQVSLMGGSQQ